MAKTHGDEMRDFGDKVKNKKMQMYLESHLNDKFHSSLQHAVAYIYT